MAIGIILKTMWLTWGLLVPSSILLVGRWGRIIFSKPYYCEHAYDHTERLQIEWPAIRREHVYLARWLLIRKLSGYTDSPENLLGIYPFSKREHRGQVGTVEAQALSKYSAPELAEWLQVTFRDNQLIPLMSEKAQQLVRQQVRARLSQLGLSDDELVPSRTQQAAAQ